MKPLLVLALALLVVGPLDYSSSKVTSQLVREADHRKELPPEEIAYWRRHERNQAECRGQTYVAHCCDDGREDLTCLHPREIR
jgi:hypothetical protein